MLIKTLNYYAFSKPLCTILLSYLCGIEQLIIHYKTVSPLYLNT